MVRYSCTNSTHVLWQYHITQSSQFLSSLILNYFLYRASSLAFVTQKLLVLDVLLTQRNLLTPHSFQEILIGILWYLAMMMIATLRNHMGNTRFHHIFRWVWITIYWSSYGYQIVTVSRGFVSDADRNYASSDSWWLWCGKYQLKFNTFSAFISPLRTHNSSAAHPAKAWPFLNLLYQYTPWAVKMSVTPSQYMQYFHPNFPNYRENVMLPYF